MAKKVTPSKKAAAPKTPANTMTPPTDAVPAVAAVETKTRKTVQPKSVAAVAASHSDQAQEPLTYERIAERAYHISRSGTGGSDYDNWLRAENELKSGV